MTQITQHTLDYAPPPRWHQRRWRRLLLVVLLLLLSGSVWRWGAFVFNRASVLYWQHECMTFAQPEDRVVYDEGPKAGLLLSERGYLRYSKTTEPMGNRYRVMRLLEPAFAGEPPVVWMSNNWKHFSDAVPCWPWADGATLFSHELISRTGVNRLVIIQRTPGIEDGLFLLGIDLDQAVFIPGTLRNDPRPVGRMYNFSGHLITHTSPQNLRIYAGQSDPADASHFTIRYEQWGQSDTLDGWLKDDGSGVTVAPRKRPTPPNGVLH
jgi:hypothetical protein